MASQLDEILRRFNLATADLAGTAISGELPVTAPVVNRLIAAQLAARETPLAAVEVAPGDEDTFTVRVVARARFVPAVGITARIERQPEFPDDPVLWLRWSMPGMGALARLAAPALAFFKALPPGVRADGDRIGVDVGALLAARGLGELADFVRALRVHTRPGAFVVQFDLRAPVEQPATGES